MEASVVCRDCQGLPGQNQCKPLVCLFLRCRKMTHFATAAVQIWPAFEFVNFYFIPKHWRPLAVNLLCVVFNAIISVTAYGHGPDDQKLKQDDDEETGTGSTRKQLDEAPQQQKALRPTKARNVMLSETASLHV